MERIFDRDYDYIDDDDSGSENGESSEDEIDILLHGTPERKLKLSRRRASSGENRHDDEASSEDDFEKEMNQELDDQVALLEAQRRACVQHAQATSTKAEDKQEGDNSRGIENEVVYDEVYFDSDEEEMVEGEKKNKKTVLSNDELMYDPNMDDDDQRWMDNRRKRYQPASQLTSTSGQKSKRALPNSDAVLDCPACMTTLCLDCQRHAVYTNQYRAMFVSHCSVDLQEVLKYPKEPSNKKQKQKKKTRFSESSGCTPHNHTDNTAEFDTYHPVRCSECNTLVAMYDKDEIYHFFNVLSSYS